MVGGGGGVAIYRKQWWTRVTALSLYVYLQLRVRYIFLTVSAEAVNTYAGTGYNRTSEQRPGNKIQWQSEYWWR